jgi:hypothetical protein
LVVTVHLAWAPNRHDRLARVAFIWAEFTLWTHRRQLLTRLVSERENVSSTSTGLANSLWRTESCRFAIAIELEGADLEMVMVLAASTVDGNRAGDGRNNERRQE